MVALRDEFGDSVGALLALHTRLEPPEAAMVCREVEPVRPFFVEDPLRSEAPDAYAALRARTGVPLAAGEQYASKWEFRALLDRDLIDYCRADICIAGGFTELRKIAGWCEAHHVMMATHNPLGVVATGAAPAPPPDHPPPPPTSVWGGGCRPPRGPPPPFLPPPPGGRGRRAPAEP